MNLIEQLGGYEKARNIRLGNEEDWMFYSISKDWYSDIKHDDSFIFIDELKYILRQYRREHGIFEVGDLITHPMFWTLFEVKETMDCHVVGITPTGYESKLALALIKHATDAEIKANKREVG